MRAARSPTFATYSEKSGRRSALQCAENAELLADLRHEADRRVQPDPDHGNREPAAQGAPFRRYNATQYQPDPRLVLERNGHVKN